MSSRGAVGCGNGARVLFGRAVKLQLLWVGSSHFCMLLAEGSACSCAVSPTWQCGVKSAAESHKVPVILLYVVDESGAANSECLGAAVSSRQRDISKAGCLCG